jgi:hypothetical protein
MKKLAPIFLLTLSVSAADLVDVTLQPWTVRKIDFEPFSGVSSGVRVLASADGFVLLHSVNYLGLPAPIFSWDSGMTWQNLTGNGVSVGDYIYSENSASTGNGCFLSSFPSNGYMVKGLISTNGQHYVGYDKMAFGNGLLVGIQSYSTYVSADQGTTQEPLLEPVFSRRSNASEF